MLRENVVFPSVLSQLNAYTCIICCRKHVEFDSQFRIKFIFFFFIEVLKMSSRKTAGRRATTKKRAQRATSNVFAMFDQAQIAEFKEAFNMIDQNHDGFIDKEDLHDMLASLGKYFKQIETFYILI